MSENTQEIEFLSTLFKVLADPTRLKLFKILLSGVQCNCTLGERAGLSNNLVSHHLSVLSKAGLIVSTRKTEDARWIYYSVDPEKLTQFQAALESFLKVNANVCSEPQCPPRRTKSIKGK